VALAGVVSLGACGVPTQPAAATFPGGKEAISKLALTPLTTRPPRVPKSDTPTVYYIKNGRLFSGSVSLEPPITLQKVLQALVVQPVPSNLSTAIPSDTKVVSA
jgi:hypothetical protein